jgi:intracellular multiplication protein IcmN
MTSFQAHKILMIFTVLLLGACHSSHQQWQEPPEYPTHAAANDYEKLKMERKLSLMRVKIIKEGQYVIVSIPSLFLFHAHSPEIAGDSYGLLNEVICYIKMFRKVEVEINSHDFLPDKQARVFDLTRARASNLAEYINSQDIDARIIFTHGMANDKPIYNNETNSNAFSNSRIEIMFKDEVI